MENQAPSHRVRPTITNRHMSDILLDQHWAKMVDEAYKVELVMNDSPCLYRP